MITITGLQKSFGARTLFRDAGLRVGARDRIALVGPNGSGKTTLFEMIVGGQEPDGGQIDIATDVTLGYLAQETDELRGRSVLEEVVGAGRAMQDAGHRLRVLERDLETSIDETERELLLAEYARLLERFDSLGGYSLQSEAERILAGLGFSTEQMHRPTDALSGGWLMRVALAKLLLSAPDALLLDEPTNHLDLESVVWLERFLGTYEGAVLVISHDRDFMNAVATTIVEIDQEQLWSYTGDYANFVEQRAIRIEQAARAAKHAGERRAQLTDFIERFRYKNTKARQVQSKIKMLERMDPGPQAPSAKRRTMRLAFPEPPRAGRVVVSLDHIDFSYGETPVYSGLSLDVERGQKIALVGPNGAGKTTLLKLIAGVLQPTGGERRLGANVVLGYFAQHQVESLDGSKRMIEEMASAVPPGVEVKLRDLLGRFLFSGDDIDKPVRVLSGGERSRLALAKMLVAAPNVLCLDEPTNHLDIASRDALEDALVEYPGTIVLITHDRHLIRSVATHIVEVVSGRVRAFPGDYEDYLERIAVEQAAVSTPSPARPDDAKERRRRSAEERQRSGRARNDLRKVERRLEEVHAEMAELGTVLADPEFYARGDGVADAVARYGRLEAEVKELEERWEHLAEELA